MRSAARKYKVIGPFNSGTNLLQRILANEPFLPIWKHEIRLKKLEKVIRRNPNILFLCMYKPLHLWVPSIIKTSYSIEWLNKKRSLGQPVIFQSRRYECISDLHYEYYTNYRYLCRKYSNVKSIEYTKLLSINEVDEYLVRRIKDVPSYMLSIKHISSVLKKPSKIHGRSMKNSCEAEAKVKMLDALRSSFVENQKIVAFFEK